MRKQILLFGLTGVGVIAQSTQYSLSDLNWTLTNANGSIVIPGQVPSDSHLDLLRAGIITEPLLEANDFTQRWIASDNWTYTADMAPILSQIDIASKNTLLLFHGIDTVANITLGGQPVAWVNNQFRQWTFNVTDIVSTLMSSINTNLTVAFESAWIYGMNTSTYTEYVFDPELTFELPGARQWVRKDQSSFGWDWGPAFAPAGIHKPAYLVSVPTSNASALSPGLFIEQSSVEVFKNGQQNSIEPDQNADWIVNVTLGLLAASDVTPSLSISIPALGISQSGLVLSAVSGGAANATWVSATITVPNGVPDLWYPHNIGTPQLYNVTVELSPGGETFTRQTGFRTIVLIQQPVPQSDIDDRGIIPGDQYHFTINGKPFYTSGSNIIPFDPFYARISTDAVRWILQSAVLSGQNMLRVWGGSVYQPSSEDTGTYSFYDICDELGILAWSEFIFSDALYPINDFLIDNVVVEAKQNVIRTNHHPSIAQWAGGNEIEELVVDIVNVSVANGTHYVNEFVTLFQDVLHDAVYQSSKSISYSDCSTTTGYLSLNPYILRFNNMTEGYLYGNTERYDYIAQDALDYTTFPVSRYVNEFGFLSMPSFYSWEEVLTSADDFSFNSTIVASRDHHNPAGGLTWPNPNAVGQAQMTEAVQYWLPSPGTSDANQTFAQWCWSTQVFQAMTMASEVAFYRRGAGHPENNLGALVWQLNDIWQAPSWASIEYSGRWKVLHYTEASIFSPVIIYPFWTASNESLEVTITSDRWDTVNGTADLTWYTWNGTQLNTSTYHFSVPTLNNTVLYSGVGLDMILPNGTSANDVFLRLNLTATVDGGTVVTNDAIFNPTGLVNATLVDPAIEVTNDGTTFTLTATGGVATWTWLDHPSGTVGYFYDTTTKQPSNGFYLIPGHSRTVTFELNTALSTNTSPDPAAFVVRSMWNNTHI